MNLTHIPRTHNDTWENGTLWAFYQDLKTKLRGAHTPISSNMRFNTHGISKDSEFHNVIKAIWRLETLAGNIDNLLLFADEMERVERGIDRAHTDYTDQYAFIYGYHLSSASINVIEGRNLNAYTRMKAFETHIKSSPRYKVGDLRIYHKDKNLVVLAEKELHAIDLCKILQMFGNLNSGATTETLTMLYDAVIKDQVNTLNSVLAYYKFHPFLQELKYINLRKALDNSSRLKRQFQDIIDTKVLEVERMMENIVLLKKEIKDYQARLAFETHEIDDETWKSYMHYFEKHPYLEDVETGDGNTIILSFKSPIEFYDIDAVKRLKNTIPNHKSTQYVFLDILEKGDYQLWTSARIATDTNTFNTMSRGSNDSTVLGHPHIDKYNCFGSFSSFIRQTVENCNYIALIDQLTAATQNLNVLDSIVLSELCRNIHSHRTLKTFKDLNTDEMVSFQDIIIKEGYEWYA